MLQMLGRVFLNPKALLTWLHQSMVYIVIGLILAMFATIQVLQANNEALGANLNAAQESIDELSGVVEGYQSQLSQIDSALLEIQQTQIQLRGETRSLYTFIDEVADDQDRADSPFWTAYFDRLRDDAPTED